MRVVLIVVEELDFSVVLLRKKLKMEEPVPCTIVASSQ